MQRQDMAVALPSAAPHGQPAQVMSTNWVAEAARARLEQASRRSVGDLMPTPGGTQFIGSAVRQHQRAVEAVQARLAQVRQGPPEPAVTRPSRRRSPPTE